MIKLFFILFCWCSCIPLFAQKNDYQLAIKAGVNYADLLGDKLSSDKTALHLGMAFTLPLVANKWFMQMEALYSEKGGSKKILNVHIQSGKGSMGIALNYIEFPFLMQYRKSKMQYEFGIGVSKLIRKSTYFYYKNDLMDTIAKYGYNKDIGGNLGIGYNTKRWLTNLRYTCSIISIAPFPIYNSTAALTLSYKLFLNRKRENDSDNEL